MLSLSRRAGESVSIGDSIAVTVVGITPQNARLEVTVHAGISIIPTIFKTSGSSARNNVSTAIFFEQGRRKRASLITLQPRQSILIGEDVEVWIRAIRGNQVRLCIAAPRRLVVLRGELTPFALTAT